MIIICNFSSINSWLLRTGSPENKTHFDIPIMSVLLMLENFIDSLAAHCLLLDKISFSDFPKNRVSLYFHKIEIISECKRLPLPL